MVANSPPEPSSETYAALVQRLDAMQRQIDEAGRASKYPFVVSHGAGVQDFAITPSTSGDGTADIAMGNGAGGKLIKVSTDAIYGTKIYQLLDQAGSSMMSTDALAGFGLGTPSYPFVYAGYESNTLAGATSQGTAREIATGVSFVYNPAVYLNVRVRMTSATAETVKVFVNWKDGQGNQTNTADITWALAAGTAVLGSTFFFGKNWQADDMNTPCAARIRAYCTSANPANVSITASYQDGYGVSQRWYNDNSPGWAV